MENEITAHQAGKVTELAVARAARSPPATRSRRSSPRSRRCPIRSAHFRGAGPRPGAPICRCRPDKMPLRRGGRWRKRWRYVGAFCDELLLCAARVQVGPLGQTFWVVWDRESGEMWEHTRTLMPGARGEVWTEHLGGERSGRARRPGCPRLRARRGLAGADRGRRPAAPTTAGPSCAAAPASGSSRSAPPTRASTCGRESGPTSRSSATFGSAIAAGGSRRAGWRTSRPAITRTTRSGAGRPASAARPTAARWAGTWSAGINDPPERSERAIWIDGEPSEPAPVSFDGLEAIAFDDGSRLAFDGECERTHDEKKLVVQSTLPPAVRHLQRHPPRRAGARERPRRHGVPRRAW